MEQDTSAERHKLSLLGTPWECERTRSQQGTSSGLVESWEPAVEQGMKHHYSVKLDY